MSNRVNDFYFLDKVKEHEASDEFRTETLVTEEIIFQILRIRNVLSRLKRMFEEKENGVFETFFDRSSNIAINQQILQVVHCAEDMEILSKRLKPGTRISTVVIATVFKIELKEPDLINQIMLEETYLTMQSLLKFGLSIRLDLKNALQMIRYQNAIDALNLEHGPLISQTEIFFSQEFHPEKLANFMHKDGTHLEPTNNFWEVINPVYSSQSEAASKKRFYSNLKMNDERKIKSVSKISAHEKMCETSHE